MTTRCQPHDVMLLLNTLFSRFDSLTDKFNVFKLETAGDCYVVTAGILSNEERNGFVSTLESHDPAASARRVMEFAKALLEETAKVKMPPSSGEASVQVRIGIHTGDVVSGLVGFKLPKFSLCGDAMCTASRLESSGQAGRIQVSETTHALLPEYAWQAKSVTVKGKGAMRSFLWDPETNEGWSLEARPLSQQSSPLPLVPMQGSNPSSERGHRMSTGGDQRRGSWRRSSPCLAEHYQLALLATETLVSGKDHLHQLRSKKACSLLAQGAVHHK
ncbi:nucleotide cyclase [Dunaliella salina]|uniref:Nucleotide cyclase n=1 Tax=Dunaliella salina TaxID=3046 RepID=A0ABQ7GQ96_DUNSA|nr:nucleotide cyclase [Dunaliella salina]|eukprot:KAF5836773.1 nucleotide cyclase [Dunaliella salina]